LNPDVKYGLFLQPNTAKHDEHCMHITPLDGVYL